MQFCEHKMMNDCVYPRLDTYCANILILISRIEKLKRNLQYRMIELFPMKRILTIQQIAVKMQISYLHFWQTADIQPKLNIHILQA